MADRDPVIVSDAVAGQLQAAQQYVASMLRNPVQQRAAGPNPSAPVEFLRLTSTTGTAYGTATIYPAIRQTPDPANLPNLTDSLTDAVWVMFLGAAVGDTTTIFPARLHTIYTDGSPVFMGIPVPPGTTFENYNDTNQVPNPAYVQFSNTFTVAAGTDATLHAACLIDTVDASYTQRGVVNTGYQYFHWKGFDGIDLGASGNIYSDGPTLIAVAGTSASPYTHALGVVESSTTTNYNDVIAAGFCVKSSGVGGCRVGSALGAGLQVTDLNGTWQIYYAVTGGGGSAPSITTASNEFLVNGTVWCAGYLAWSGATGWKTGATGTMSDGSQVLGGIIYSLGSGGASLAIGNTIGGSPVSGGVLYADGSGDLADAAGFTYSAGVLSVPSIALTTGAAAGYVWTSSGTSGAGSWQPAGVAPTAGGGSSMAAMQAFSWMGF